uniref:Uncharacterized protein n=1 Tax=Candidatus Kentrum sp. TUN TaxID=2126343 RepID=A0A451ABT0_9GAMM|nr:MAG: hypothetical protein BECKTUN1418F_GA0071002_12733 [Candidatus Kentron sp. TUN]VFK63504.1 MAG: hypothetical protein BECKTUN1418D_GA0071000_12161 [Candidatus Kentron sp. TUN]VFK70602.1 MAG: hypothetical protein BECKTUN1418E_GA0071001_12714 [Candidatus Kentron sp. TUN]
MALFRILPVIENGMHDNFLTLDGIKYREGESSNHATTEVGIGYLIHFRKIDDVSQGSFHAIEKLETKPPPLHFIPFEGHLDIFFRFVRVANLHL